MRRFFISACMVVLLGGCTRTLERLPFVYRIDIQQGNVVTQEQIDQLRPGMTREQVRYLLGTPLVQDTFHPERWDYVYYFKPGRG
ncbi:MAG: outer membrane protein assembly factor BamE, partial [Gammaproteobacteria bacterium]